MTTSLQRETSAMKQEQGSQPITRADLTALMKQLDQIINRLTPLEQRIAAQEKRHGITPPAPAVLEPFSSTFQLEQPLPATTEPEQATETPQLAPVAPPTPTAALVDDQSDPTAPIKPEPKMTYLPPPRHSYKPPMHRHQQTPRGSANQKPSFPLFTALGREIASKELGNAVQGLQQNQAFSPQGIG